MVKKYPTIITAISILIFLALIAAVLFSNLTYRETPEAPPPAPARYVAPQRNLTPQERAALDIPLHSASAQEKKQHTETVADLAKTAPALDITGCKPEPLVYKVELKGNFQIVNRDAIPHMVRYLGIQIKVPAEGATTVKTSRLFKTAGNYGYGCDNPFAKMGIFMVR